MDAMQLNPAENRGRTARRDKLVHGDGRLYMSRWFLFDKFKKPWTPRLHVFHSSDADAPHDHPADFWAVAVWGWATEVRYRIEGERLVESERRRVLPFIPRRTAKEVIHRIVNPKALVTLVAFRRYCRRWGFWIPVEDGHKWVDHATYKRGVGVMALDTP